MFALLCERLEIKLAGGVFERHLLRSRFYQILQQSQIPGGGIRYQRRGCAS